MNYIEMINDAIEYIENNLNRAVSLDELAAKYYISHYHFYRIFRSLTSKTLSDYINQRRLTEAAKKIKATKKNIIDIAFDYGYESHEAFSRSFKKFFTVTPIECRKLDFNIPVIEKKEIIERKFKNFHNDIIVDFRIQHLGPVELIGRRIKFNQTVMSDLDKLVNLVQKFVTDVVKPQKIEHLYNVIKSEIGVNEDFSYFTGCEMKQQHIGSDFVALTVPKSDYAVFKYSADMVVIYKTVFEDIRRSLLVSGLNLNQSLIDFISMEVYDENYFNTKQFYIYIPIC